MLPKNNNELINTQFEKELTGLAIQGYSILKKYLNQRKASKEICIKCGSYAIMTSFCRTDHANDNRFSISLKHGTEEMLHRSCDTCGYSYLAIPMDAKT